MSRTDRGVHATQNIVRFFSTEEFTLRRINSQLPKEIRALKILPGWAEPIKKTYTYVVDTNPILSPFDRFRVWHYPYSLDLTLMRNAATPLIGTHDFFPLQTRGRTHTTTIRHLESLTITGSGTYTFSLTGNSFLYRMVRNIVGLLVLAGRGKQPSGNFTAPAHGLTLTSIVYDLKERPLLVRERKKMEEMSLPQ